MNAEQMNRIEQEIVRPENENRSGERNGGTYVQRNCGSK